MRCRFPGAEHFDTLTSATGLAYALGKMGELEEAAQLHRQTFEVRTRILGEEHPDSLMSAHALAWVLSGQGGHTEAAKLRREALVAQSVVGCVVRFFLTFSLHWVFHLIAYCYLAPAPAWPQLRDDPQSSSSSSSPSL
jgi:hypothetical protein